MEPVQFSWQLIVTIIAGLWELVVRILPNVPIKYSFIQKIIDILLWVSNFLNRKKK